jgi:hypothetical protein
VTVRMGFFASVTVTLPVWFVVGVDRLTWLGRRCTRIALGPHKAECTFSIGREDAS